MKTIRVHGDEIPALGFGTYQISAAEAEESVQDALNIGYRHIDTAQFYDNEAGVGRALSASSVAREDLFLTTKVWPTRYDDLPASVDESLRRLQTEYVDLLLLHWPRFDASSMEKTIDALNRVHAAGKARSIGVSNFTTTLLSEARALSEAPLVANQVEYHPFLRQTPILEAVRDAGMTLTAYSPLAKGRVVRNETLANIGQRHGKSPAQVALRWLLQQEAVSAIPKASSPEHRRENFQVFDFTLFTDEMRTIHGLARPDGRITSPGSLAPTWDEPERYGEPSEDSPLLRMS